MWIIKPSRVREFAIKHPSASLPLERWLILTTKARWNSLADIRKLFRSADEVCVASLRKAVIFNIKGNHFRLVTAVHYNTGKVFVLMFLTHAEYDKNSWKDIL